MSRLKSKPQRSCTQRQFTKPDTPLLRAPIAYPSFTFFWNLTQSPSYAPYQGCVILGLVGTSRVSTAASAGCECIEPGPTVRSSGARQPTHQRFESACKTTSSCFWRDARRRSFCLAAFPQAGTRRTILTRARSSVAGFCPVPILEPVNRLSRSCVCEPSVSCARGWRQLMARELDLLGKLSAKEVRAIVKE